MTKNKLKGFCLFIEIAFLAIICGCNHTDPRVKMLTKKWSYQEFQMEDQRMTGKQLGDPTMEFKEDGTYILEFGAMSENGTWSLKGNDLETTSKSNDQTNTLVIKELTDNKLVFQGKAEGSEVTITLAPVASASTE